MTAYRIMAAVTAAFLAASHAGAQEQQPPRVDLAEYDYENLQFRGVGMDIGRIWPSNLEEAMPVRLRFDLGYLGPGVRIMPSIAYWKADVEQGEIEVFERQLEENNNPPLPEGTIELGDVEISDFTLQVDAHFVWTTPIDLLIYVGAGVGLHLLNGQGEGIDDTFVEDLFDSVMPGVTALGGLEYAVVDRVRVYGEAHFTVVSDILSPGIRAGAAIMLPTRVQGD
jgi:opacity protein-like surface antigen